MNNDNSIKGLLFAFMAAIASSVVFLASKGAMLSLNSTTFCIVWFFFGSIYYLIYFSLTGNLKKYYHISLSDMKILLVFGLMETISAFLFFEGVKQGNPGTLAFVANSCGILFLLIFGIVFLRERFNFVETIGLIFVGLGIYVMEFKGGHFDNSALLIIIGTIFFSIGTIIVKTNKNRIDNMTFSSVRPILIVLYSTIYAIVFHKVEIPSFKSFNIMLLGAFFGPFCSMTFYYIALKYVEASKVIIVRTIQPVIVLGGTYMIFNQFATSKELIGAGILSFGVLILVLGKIKSKINIKKEECIQIN